MGFSLILVIGLVVLAMIIAIAYEDWAERRYETVRLPLNEVTTLFDVYLTNESKKVGSIVAYRTAEPMPPWRLMDQLEEKLKMRPKYGVVTTEPGYSSFMILRKNWLIFEHSLESWSNSPFHTIIMPLEIALRLTVLPLQAMLDLVSHDRCVIIAFIPIDKDFVTPKSFLKGISIVEGMDNVFIKPVKSIGEFTLVRSSGESTDESAGEPMSESTSDIIGESLLM